MTRVTSSSAQCGYGLGAGVREEGDASHCPGSLQDCCLAMTPCPQALFMLGVMLGSYIFGWLSDRWGRKLSFFLSLILQVLQPLSPPPPHLELPDGVRSALRPCAGLLDLRLPPPGGKEEAVRTVGGWLGQGTEGRVSSFVCFIVVCPSVCQGGGHHQRRLPGGLRAGHGDGGAGLQVPLLPLLPPTTTSMARVLAGTLCQYYYTTGYLVMAGLAYLLHDSWQLLQIVLTLPSILFLSYWSASLPLRPPPLLSVRQVDSVRVCPLAAQHRPVPGGQGADTEGRR